MKPIKSVKADVEAAVPRDQWDRPKIIRPGEDKPTAYRRASTVAEVLEDHYGLNKWLIRLTAEGLAQRPDLVQAIHDASKKEIGLIAEEAQEQAGASIASRNGSTLHGLTDRIDRGEPLPKGLPPNIRKMLEVYKETFSQRFEVLDIERFVVQDKIKVAGTYDRRVRDRKTGKVYIGDLKTGQSLDHLALKAPAQVSIYAASKHYDLDGNREPHGAERDWGLLVWLPWAEEPDEVVCELRWLDLRVGRESVKEAFRVERFRGIKPNQTMLHVKD